MSENNDLQAKIDQLQASNDSLVGTIKSFAANKKALETTVQELMNANINLKGSLEMSASHANENAVKIKNLEDRIKEFEAKEKAAAEAKEAAEKAAAEQAAPAEQPAEPAAA